MAEPSLRNNGGWKTRDASIDRALKSFGCNNVLVRTKIETRSGSEVRKIKAERGRTQNESENR